MVEPTDTHSSYNLGWAGNGGGDSLHMRMGGGELWTREKGKGMARQGTWPTMRSCMVKVGKLDHCLDTS